MQFADDSHATDETLERYSMNCLAGPELAKFEEHLLVCETCQDRLAYEDRIRQAVCDGAAVLDRPHTAPTWRAPKLAWAFGMAALGLVVFAGTSWQYLRHAGTPAVVLLQATRGIDNSAPGAVLAGKPLKLIPDLTGLPSFSEYGVEVVEGGGHAAYQSKASLQNSRLEVTLTRGLHRGAYFVRVSAPGGELLREYALVVGE